MEEITSDVDVEGNKDTTKTDKNTFVSENQKVVVKITPNDKKPFPAPVGITLVFEDVEKITVIVKSDGKRSTVMVSGKRIYLFLFMV